MRLPSCRCGACPGCRQLAYQRRRRARIGESAAPDLLRHYEQCASLKCLDLSDRSRVAVLEPV